MQPRRMGRQLTARLSRAASSTSHAAVAGPSALLSAAVTTNGWKADRAQTTAADLLQQLWECRVQRSNSSLTGIYLHGPVGSGKTALMDLTLQAGADANLACKRMHFHELMTHAHAQMHTAKRSPLEIGRALGVEANDLLCLDEMQITDIADAAIVSRVVGGILQAGAALVTTSNRPPDELYSGGLNRHVYIPALCATLAQHGVVQHCLAADGGDYRQVRVQQARQQHQQQARQQHQATVANGGGVNSTMASRLQTPHLASRYHADQSALVASLEARGGPLEPQPPLALSRSRSLPIPQANAGGCCVLSFDEVCDTPLSARDYLTLSEAFPIIGLSGVPPLTTERHNAARRLITLIDILYDRSVELHVASCTPMDRLFDGLAGAVEVANEHDAPAQSTPEHEQQRGVPSAATGAAGHAAAAGGVAVSMRGSGGASARLSSTWLSDGSEWSATGRLGVSLAALSGLQDAAFARRRALSRLREMCLSEGWPREG